MLVSTASADEADDGEQEMLALLNELEPELKAAHERARREQERAGPRRD